MTLAVINLFILGGTMACMFIFGLIWHYRSEKQRAREVHENLHGEAVNFAKFHGNSSTFLFELVRLEAEREEMKRTKLTNEERDAAREFLSYLRSSLPFALTMKQREKQWKHGRCNPEFAKKAMAWKKSGTYVPQPGDEMSPAELVEELAKAAVPMMRGNPIPLPTEPGRLLIPRVFVPTSAARPVVETHMRGSSAGYWLCGAAATPLSGDETQFEPSCPKCKSQLLMQAGLA